MDYHLQIEDWPRRQQLYKMHEAAEIFGITYSTLWRRIKKGHIEAIDTPLGTRITANEIGRVLKGKPKRSAAEAVLLARADVA